MNFIVSLTDAISRVFHHISRVTVLFQNLVHLILASSHRWKLLHELNVFKRNFPFRLVGYKHLSHLLPVSISYRRGKYTNIGYLKIIVGNTCVVNLALWRSYFIDHTVYILVRIDWKSSMVSLRYMLVVSFLLIVYFWVYLLKLSWVSPLLLKAFLLFKDMVFLIMEICLELLMSDTAARIILSRVFWSWYLCCCRYFIIACLSTVLGLIILATYVSSVSIWFLRSYFVLKCWALRLLTIRRRIFKPFVDASLVILWTS